MTMKLLGGGSNLHPRRIFELCGCECSILAHLLARGCWICYDYSADITRCRVSA